MKQKMMGSLANYFDYEACARELFNWDYNMEQTVTFSVESVPSNPSASRAFPKGKAIFAEKKKEAV